MENGGSRKLVSMKDLHESGEFFTVDSTMMRRIENLLIELPGNVTYNDIAKLLSDKAPEFLVPEPRLCNSSSGIFGELVQDEWQPSAISRRSSTSVVTKWRPIAVGSDQLWRRADFDTLDRGIANAIDFILDTVGRMGLFSRRLRAPGRGNTVACFIPAGQVDFDGLDDYDTVSVNGAVYVLPGSEIMNIQMGERATENDRLAVISALAGKRSALDDRDIEATRAQLVRVFDSSMIGEIVSLETIISHLKRPDRMFDVGQWDRLTLIDVSLY
jgi:hypothetical protein